MSYAYIQSASRLSLNISDTADSLTATQSATKNCNKIYYYVLAQNNYNNAQQNTNYISKQPSTMIYFQLELHFYIYDKISQQLVFYDYQESNLFFILFQSLKHGKSSSQNSQLYGYTQTRNKKSLENYPFAILYSSQDIICKISGYIQLNRITKQEAPPSILGILYNDLCQQQLLPRTGLSSSFRKILIALIFLRLIMINLTKKCIHQNQIPYLKQKKYFSFILHQQFQRFFSIIRTITSLKSIDYNLKFKLLMLKYIIFTILLYHTFNLNSTLPQLIKRNYKGTASKIINTTVGEQFSLPLPHFDTTWNKQNFKVYQITEEQFIKYSSNPSNVWTQQKTTQNNPKSAQPIGMDYLPFECSLMDGNTFVSQQIKSVRQQYSRAKKSRWQQNQYVLLSSKSLLYILNSAASELIAYIYNDHTIEKITTYKLDQMIQREQQQGELSISPPVIAANSNQEILYIFTSLGIWEVKTKTILSNVRYIGNLSGFNSADIGGLDKVLHGEVGILIGLKRSTKKVYIIPEPSLNSSQKHQFSEIGTFQKTQMFPHDIAIISNTLYILDFYKGIYLFSILRQGIANPRSLIPFDSFGGNFQFRVYKNTVFINFNDIQGSKIAQINVDIDTDNYNLVRFIKSDQFINIFKVFSSVPTQYLLQPTNQKFRQDYIDSFIFLIQNYDDIEIYPFNIDPRMINTAYNAVKLKGNNIREIFHIYADKYIIISNEYIQYLRLTILKPSIVCKTRKPSSKAPQNYYRISLISNISTCQHRDNTQVIKNNFNELCQMELHYYVHIGDPEESQYQKLLLYTIVIGVIICFIAGLLCLIQWRNNKMVILGRLKNQIVNFRNRHKRIQPFVEENYQQKDFQIDVPRVTAVLQNQ